MFVSIEDALAEIRAGRMVIVVDDEDRENEGDLLMAAEKATPETVNFMATYGRGLICVPLPADQADSLELPPMVTVNTDHRETAFTVSVDSRVGVTTGISAHDRAATINQLASPTAKAGDFNRPGHIFPLRAKEGGVLRRAGHTEAAVDLARLAGLQPVGVICEILKEDGTMARIPDLLPFAETYGLKMITIADLIAYRRRTEKLVRRISEAKLPTRYGYFRAIAYEDLTTKEVHLALVKGDLPGPEPTLVRVHSECLTGDVLGSLRCDCGEQLETALKMIEEAGHGVLVYLRQEGRGIGLGPKIAAYALQDLGQDTVEANLSLGYPADLRDYGTGAQILADLGLHHIAILTNNPKKMAGLEGYGLSIDRRVPLQIPAGAHNHRYLETKRHKLGHLLLDEGENHAD